MTLKTPIIVMGEDGERTTDESMVNETLAIGSRTVGYDELVDSETAGRIMGLASRTIRDMGTYRTLPVYKLGYKTNRFLVRDLVAYVEARRIDITES